MITDNAIDPPLAAALIGCGTTGRRVAHAAATLSHITIGRYIDANESTAARLARSFGSDDASSEVNSAFLRNDVQAILVATPYSTHAGLTSQAAEHLKHVFVPPPIALRAAHAENLRRQLDASPVVCCVDFALRMTPAVALIKTHIPKPSLITVQATTDSLADVWPGEAEQGGVMAHVGHGALDLACYLAASAPVRVFASGGRYTRRAGLPDTFFAIIRFASDALAQVVIGEFGRNRTVSGLWGTVTDGVHAATLWNEAGCSEIRKNERPVARISNSKSTADMNVAMLAAFSLAVRNKGKPPTGPADGARAVGLADAVYESMSVGRKVDIT